MSSNLHCSAALQGFPDHPCQALNRGDLVEPACPYQKGVQQWCRLQPALCTLTRLVEHLQIVSHAETSALLHDSSWHIHLSKQHAAHSCFEKGMRCQHKKHCPRPDYASDRTEAHKLQKLQAAMAVIGRRFQNTIKPPPPPPRWCVMIPQQGRGVWIHQRVLTADRSHKYQIVLMHSMCWCICLCCVFCKRLQFVPSPDLTNLVTILWQQTTTKQNI